MKLRTQIVMAFLLLAVLPLTAVTVFSYLTSLRAFHRAVAAESGAVTADMGRRMDAVTRDLGRRLAHLEDLPLSRLVPEAKGSPPPPGQVWGDLQAEMGDVGNLLEFLEVLPVPGTHPPGLPPEGGVLIRPPSPPEPPVPAEAERRTREAEEVGEEIGRRVEALTRDIENRVQETLRDRNRPDEIRRAAREAAASARASAAARTEVRHRRDNRLLLGRDFQYTLRRDGEPVGTVRAQLRSAEILRSVLSRTRRRKEEIPFAMDAEGRIHAAEPADAARITALGVRPAPVSGEPQTQVLGDWLVVIRREPSTSLCLGLARPVRESLTEIRRTAALNLSAGLGLAGFALLGVLPLSRRMTRDLATLTQGVEQLSKGDLQARVPVRTRDEFGLLAAQFNRMAEELRINQEGLLRQERLQKELEISRRIQEELLPHQPLLFPFAEVKGISVPAREVGGDFFNYFPLPAGEVAVLMGDVSGKGVPAALLMANLQATLKARLPLERDLAVLGSHLDREIEASTPQTAYLTLFMGVIDAQGRTLRYVNAGHNTQFLLRAGGGVEPLESTGRPLGLYPGGGYEERRVPLADGDCLFLFTDGLVDAEDAHGESFGMERLSALVEQERHNPPEVILARVEEAVRAHRGPVEAADDATMLVLKVGPSA